MSGTHSLRLRLVLAIALLLTAALAGACGEDGDGADPESRLDVSTASPTETVAGGPASGAPAAPASVTAATFTPPAPAPTETAAPGPTEEAVRRSFLESDCACDYMGHAPTGSGGAGSAGLGCQYNWDEARGQVQVSMVIARPLAGVDQALADYRAGMSQYCGGAQTCDISAGHFESYETDGVRYTLLSKAPRDTHPWMGNRGAVYQGFFTTIHVTVPAPSTWDEANTLLEQAETCAFNAIDRYSGTNRWESEED